MGGQGWIGVDFDGTLVTHVSGGAKRVEIGDPVPRMVTRVKRWLSEGKRVKIFTARVDQTKPEAGANELAIQDWCQEQFGQVLEVTNVKDVLMLELWDDRAFAVRRDDGTAAHFTDDEHRFLEIL